MSIEKLTQDRQNCAKELLALNDQITSDGKVSKEQTASFDALQSKIAELDLAIKASKSINDTVAIEKFAKGAPTALINSPISTFDNLSPRDQAYKVLDVALRGGKVKADFLADNNPNAIKIFNDLSKGTDSAGGFLVPQELQSVVVDAKKLYSGLRNFATIIQSDNGRDLELPRTNTTSQLGEIIAENTETTDATDFTFSLLKAVIYKYSSKTQAVSMELMQDSQFDIVNYMISKCAERIGRLEGSHFATGTGTGQPHGIVTGATVGVTTKSGQTTTLIYDDLVDVIASVDPAYRGVTGGGSGDLVTGGCCFLMNDSTLQAVRKIKDSDGRPLFLPSIQTGSVGTLFNYPVMIINELASLAAASKSVVFGKLSNYYIKDVVSPQYNQINVYTDSRYAEKGQTGYQMFQRTGARLFDNGDSVKVIQQAAS